jgi:hypothetical protein
VPEGGKLLDSYQLNLLKKRKKFFTAPAKAAVERVSEE